MRWFPQTRREPSIGASYVVVLHIIHFIVQFILTNLLLYYFIPCQLISQIDILGAQRVLLPRMSTAVLNLESLTLMQDLVWSILAACRLSLSRLHLDTLSWFCAYNFLWNEVYFILLGAKKNKCNACFGSFLICRISDLHCLLHIRACNYSATFLIFQSSSEPNVLPWICRLLSWWIWISFVCVESSCLIPFFSSFIVRSSSFPLCFAISLW